MTSPSLTVPFIASWSAETTTEPLVVADGLRGIRYADELPTDRDEHGVLWLNRPNRPGQGRPRFAVVHHGRQRRAMRDLLCQVCGGPADRDEHGVLWLLEDNRDDWPDWPENLYTTHPPICIPCLHASRAQCPHLRPASVAVRVKASEVCGVYGRRYAPGTLRPVSVGKAVAEFGTPAARWTLASQLVRALTQCTFVDIDRLTPGAPR